MYKAILLDLNSTLSENWRKVGVGRYTSEDKIRNIERYRAWLADWLRRVDSKVFIFTVRPARTQEATLETISKRLSWTPDGAYFNHTPTPAATPIKSSPYFWIASWTRPA